MEEICNICKKTVASNFTCELQILGSITTVCYECLNQLGDTLIDLDFT